MRKAFVARLQKNNRTASAAPLQLGNPGVLLRCRGHLARGRAGSSAANFCGQWPHGRVVFEAILYGPRGKPPPWGSPKKTHTHTKKKKCALVDSGPKKHGIKTKQGSFSTRDTGQRTGGGIAVLLWVWNSRACCFGSAWSGESARVVVCAAFLLNVVLSFQAANKQQFSVDPLNSHCCSIYIYH